jgi:hypothetical protein
MWYSFTKLAPPAVSIIADAIGIRPQGFVQERGGIIEG